VQGIEDCYYIYGLTSVEITSLLLFATLTQHFDKLVNTNMINLCIKSCACLPSEDAAIETDCFMY